jgi:hypothetical protein
MKVADSGSRRGHAFCGDCGAPMFRLPTVCSDLSPRPRNDMYAYVERGVSGTIDVD